MSERDEQPARVNPAVGKPKQPSKDAKPKPAASGDAASGGAASGDAAPGEELVKGEPSKAKAAKGGGAISKASQASKPSKGAQGAKKGQREAEAEPPKAEPPKAEQSSAEDPEGSPTEPTALDKVFEAAFEHRFLAVPGVILAAIATGFLLGLGAALLVLAGGVLLLVIALFWGSVQSLTGETDLSLDEALSLAAPSAEYEQKRAVLRALKDLEFEYRIGKISQADYDDLSLRYRAEAKRLLQQLAEVEADARAEAERLLERRLRKLKLPPAPHIPKAAVATAKGAAAKADPDAAVDGAVDDRGSEPPEQELAAGPLAGGVEAHATAAAAGELADELAAERLEDDGAAPAPSGSVQSGRGGEQPADVSAEQDYVDDPVAPAQKPAAGPSRRCKVCETRNELAARQCTGCSADLAAPGEWLCESCPAVFSDKEPACPVCGVEVEA